MSRAWKRTTEVAWSNVIPSAALDIPVVDDGEVIPGLWRSWTIVIAYRASAFRSAASYQARLWLTARLEEVLLVQLVDLAPTHLASSAQPPLPNLDEHPRHRHLRRPPILEQIPRAHTDGRHHPRHRRGTGGRARVGEGVWDRPVLELLLHDRLGDEGAEGERDMSVFVGLRRKRAGVLAENVEVFEVAVLDLKTVRRSGPLRDDAKYRHTSARLTPGDPAGQLSQIRRVQGEPPSPELSTSPLLPFPYAELSTYSDPLGSDRPPRASLRLHLPP